MCLFNREEAVKVKGLLKRAEDFPIPVGEKFPGDVMIGWKFWSLPEADELRSPTFRTVWVPGRPVVSSKPKDNRGCGIYCYGSETPAESKARGIMAGVWGSIALWGTVLNFPDGFSAFKQGCMGEFAYPLEIHLPGDYPLFASLKFAARWTPTGTDVFRGDEQL